MLEKVRQKARRLRDRGRKAGRKNVPKKVVALFFLFLGLGIVLAFLLQKALLVFFLPVAFLAFFFTAPPKREGSEGAEPFFRSFFAYLALTHDARLSFDKALEDLPISPLRERIENGLAQGTLSPKDFMEEGTVEEGILAEKTLRLLRKEEVLVEDLDDWKAEWSRKEKDRTPFPATFLLLLLVLLLLVLGTVL